MRQTDGLTDEQASMESPDLYYEPFDATIKHPFFMTVAGPSQAGKTSFVLNLLDNWERLVNENIDYIVWFYRQENSITRVLPKLYGRKQLSVIRGLPDDFEPHIVPFKKGLFIFDDLMTQSSQNASITQLISNKVHHASLSVISIVQDLFSPGRERTSYQKSCHYLILFSNPLNNSVAQIVGQRVMPGRQKVFLEIFKHAVRRPHGYLFIDGCQTTPDKARLKSDIFGSVQHVYNGGKLT